MNILIVEDDSSFALILSRTLKKIGHTVTVTKDGTEAWAALQREAFPLVISDWMMPQMEGPELCRRIRARVGVPYTYVILLTSRRERQDRIDGLYSGADDFLAKPLEYGELFARLEIAQRILTMQETLQWQNERMAETNQLLETAYHRFADLFQGLPVACYAYDDAGTVHEWNRAAAELFEYAPSEAKGQPIWLLVPEEGGAPLWRAQMAQILAGQTHTATEVQTRTRMGVMLHLLSHTIPIRSLEGRITGVISAAMDITTRRVLEQRVAAQLQQVTSLNAELEQFASIACHDLQEPLRKIQLFSSRLADQYGDTLGPQGADCVSHIQGASERMQALIRALFALTQVDRAERPFVLIDLGQAAGEVVTDLETSLEETGGRVEIGPLPSLLGDPLQIRQLLQNLIGNGLKYHRPGEPPLVTLRAVGTKGLTGAEGLSLEVADNGIGFEEQYLTRIFAPFQRLHGRGEYEGTGIGLAICKKIMDRHGGTITARSTPGDGATFRVEFPHRR